MRALGPRAALLADAEGLTGHAEAIRTRLRKEKPRD
jgi:histidinol dehydrogenase